MSQWREESVLAPRSGGGAVRRRVVLFTEVGKTGEEAGLMPYRREPPTKCQMSLLNIPA